VVKIVIIFTPTRYIWIWCYHVFGVQIGIVPKENQVIMQAKRMDVGIGPLGKGGGLEIDDCNPLS